VFGVRLDLDDKLWFERVTDFISGKENVRDEKQLAEQSNTWRFKPEYANKD
jgi:hypothetical protein